MYRNIKNIEKSSDGWSVNSFKGRCLWCTALFAINTADEGNMSSADEVMAEMCCSFLTCLQALMKINEKGMYWVCGRGCSTPVSGEITEDGWIQHVQWFYSLNAIWHDLWTRVQSTPNEKQTNQITHFHTDAQTRLLLCCSCWICVHIWDFWGKTLAVTSTELTNSNRFSWNWLNANNNLQNILKLRLSLKQYLISWVKKCYILDFKISQDTSLYFVIFCCLFFSDRSCTCQTVCVSVGGEKHPRDCAACLCMRVIVGSETGPLTWRGLYTGDTHTHGVTLMGFTCLSTVCVFVCASLSPV